MLLLRSGLPNFCAVALALNDAGYKAVGVRIDSGDLAYLSSIAKKTFRAISERFLGGFCMYVSKFTIIRSNLKFLQCNRYEVIYRFLSIQEH